MALAALIALSIALRMGFLWATHAYGQVVNNDGASYNQIATSLLQGHGFAWGPGQPTAYRLFGYPWLLSAVYAVAGPSPAALQWAQALLSAVTVAVTYALARSLAGSWAALLAGLGVALHPVLIYLTGLTAPEIPALVCQMLVVWCAWRICRGAAPTRWAVAGFIASAALGVWMRPELVLIVWLLPLAALFGQKKRVAQARTLLLAAALATALAVLPPTIRNMVVFHEVIPFPTIGGATFWGANNAHANGGWLLPSPELWPDANPPQLGMLGWSGVSESQSQARFYQASFNWMRSDPAAALRLVPQKLLRSWTLTFANETQGHAAPLVVEWLNAVFGVLVLWGMAFAWRRRDRLLVALLLVPIAAWLIKTVVFYGSARQTAAALPVLFIFAAALLADLGGRIRILRHTSPRA